MAAYEQAPWQNFYLMVGGAAAALTGLLFVSMSLHATAITGNRFYRNRAVGTLTALTTQLLLAGAVLVPGQSLMALGLEVEGGALAFLGLSVRALVLRLRGPLPDWEKMPRATRAAEVIYGLIWNVALIVSGVSLLARSGGGFYVLAVYMLMGFGWNVYVAWVLIAELSE